MFFADFTIVMLIVLIVSYALTLLLLYWSRILAIIPLLVCIFTLCFAFLVFGVFTERPALNIEPNETRLDTEVSMTEVHIRPLDKTPYYLIRNGEKYIYRSMDGDDGKAPEIDVSRCEIKFGSEEPSVAIQSTTITRRIEWLFLYNYKTEQEKKILITVTNEESILNLDK